MMRRSWIRGVYAAAAGALALALTAAPVCAESLSEQDMGPGMADIAAQVDEANERDPFASEEGHPLEAQASRPPFFDLRHVMEGGIERNYVTPVRLQNPFGSCWGFGAIAAAETSLLGSGLATDASTLDLSEKQVVWYIARPIDDPTSSQDGEGRYFRDPMTSGDYYNVGGVTVFATGLFAAGTGPTAEATATNYGDIFRYKGLHGEVVNTDVKWLDEQGQEQHGFRAAYYSEDDDWSMPEAYRFQQDYRLRESYLMPSLAFIEDDEDKGEAIDAIKDQLLAHRAVAINFYSESSQPGQDTAFTDILSENWAQYDSMGMPSSHVVTIIGYDDNYPRSKFVTAPPHDGAWLVKNSWGSDLNGFPNNGYRHWGLQEGMDVPGSTTDYAATSPLHTGYFWLSYYDRSIRDPESYRFDLGDDEVIDQYDLMPVSDYLQYATDVPNRCANVFRAAQDERLESISFITTTPGMSVSYAVYLLDDDAKNPNDGTCVVMGGPVEYALGGYHRVDLDADERLTLAAGQRYAIVVEQRTPAGKYSFTVNQSVSELTSYRGDYWFLAKVNEGESYFFVDGVWHDLSDDSIRGMFEDWRKQQATIDNFSIKAYAVPAEAPAARVEPERPEGDARAPYLEVRRSTGQLADDYTLDLRESVRYRFSIKGGTGDVAVQPTLEWSCSDDSVLAIETTKGKAGPEFLVKPLASGKATLTADAGIYGSTSFTITVPKLSIHNAEVAEKDRVVVYTGEPFEPEPVNVEMSTMDYEVMRTDVVRGVDYEVEYQDNVKCGRAQVIVRGIGQYGGEVKSENWHDMSFLIQPAKAQITRVVGDDGALAVEWASQQESGITGYLLTYREKGETEAKQLKFGADATSARIEGLKKGATYELRLRAYVTTDDYDAEHHEWSPADHYGEKSELVSCVAAKAEPERKPDDGSKADPGKDGKSGSKDGTSNGSNSGSKSDANKGASNGSSNGSSQRGTNGAPSGGTTGSGATPTGTRTTDTGVAATSVPRQSMAQTGDLAAPFMPVALVGALLVAVGLVTRRKVA